MYQASMYLRPTEFSISEEVDMRNKVIIAVLLFVIVLSPVALSCSGPGSAAINVAKGWTGDEANLVSMSSDLADLVIENIPGVNPVQKMNIKNQIAGKLSWHYSAAELDANSYSVIAAATVTTLNIPLVGIYDFSVDYQLTIDTAGKEVSSSTIDESSFDYVVIQEND